VVLDSEGRSIFADLMMGRGEPSYCAFDLVWLNGRDLRQNPLLIRKRMLRQLVPQDHPRFQYMSHVDSGGRFSSSCVSKGPGRHCLQAEEKPLSVHMDQGEESGLHPSCRTTRMVRPD